MKYEILEERIKKELELKKKILEVKYYDIATIKEITDKLNISTSKYFRTINANTNKWRLEKCERIIRRLENKDIETMERELRLLYPDVQYSKDLTTKEEEKEKLQCKKIEGLGTYLYYPSKERAGKIKEIIINYLEAELRKRGIKYKELKEPETRRYGRKVNTLNIVTKNYRIIIEETEKRRTRKETRNMFKEMTEYPENTILIKNYKMKRGNFEKLNIGKNVLTIPEFLSWIKKENHK